MSQSTNDKKEYHSNNPPKSIDGKQLITAIRNEFPFYKIEDLAYCTTLEMHKLGLIKIQCTPNTIGFCHRDTMSKAVWNGMMMVQFQRDLAVGGQIRGDPGIFIYYGEDYIWFTFDHDSVTIEVIVEDIKKLVNSPESRVHCMECDVEMGTKTKIDIGHSCNKCFHSWCVSCGRKAHSVAKTQFLSTGKGGITCLVCKHYTALIDVKVAPTM